MASEIFWTIGFVCIAAVIVVLFARLVYRSVKGANCHCGGAGGKGCAKCGGGCSSCASKCSGKKE
ncbi:MAG TPA: hypothetical protein O0X70_01930 [Methanocorpusculum sp.]|nr:hypothetical protein [Methanocorpusculum sp.]